MIVLTAKDFPPFFHICNAKTGKVLTVDFADSGPNNIHAWEYGLMHKLNYTDSSLWYARDMTGLGTAFVNKKSGYYFASIDPNRYSTLSTYYPSSYTMAWKVIDAGNDTCQIQLATPPQPSMIANGLLKQMANDAANNYLNSVAVVGGAASDPLAYWTLKPQGSLDPGYDLSKGDRSKIAGGIEAVGGVVADTLKLVGDMVKSFGAGKPNETAAAVIYSVTLAAKLTSGIAGLVNYFSDEGDDPTEMLYRFAVPALRDLIQKFDEIRINQAAGHAAAARDEFAQVSEAVQRALAKLPPGKQRISDKDMRDALGGGMADLLAVMNSARQNFDLALGILETDEDGFVPWIQVASQSLAFEQLRLLIDPVSHANLAYAHADHLSKHASTTITKTVEARLKKVVNGIDTFYPAPNKPLLTPAQYAEHITINIHIAMDNASARQLIAACEAMMKTVDALA